MRERQGDPEVWGSQRERDEKRECKAEEHSRTQIKGVRKRGKQPSRETPKIQNVPGSGGVKTPVHRSPWSPAAGGRKLPGWKCRTAPPPCVTKIRRVARTPSSTG